MVDTLNETIPTKLNVNFPCVACMLDPGFRLPAPKETTLHSYLRPTRLNSTP